MKKLVYTIFVIACISCAQKKTPEAFVYKGEYLRSVYFPVGGIATGNITVGGRGNIAEMEIFNAPNKYKTPEMYNMIWVKPKGKKALLKVLERKMFEPFTGGFGVWHAPQFSGFSRFDEVIFRGEFPFAKVAYLDGDVPLKIELETFSPFIPLDVNNSSFPAAVFHWNVTNTSSEEVEMSLVFHMKNPLKGKNKEGYFTEGNVNAYLRNDLYQGIHFFSKNISADSAEYGELVYVTTDPVIEVQTSWYNGGWWDAYHIITDDIMDDGHIKIKKDTAVKTREANDNSQFATILVHASLKPGENKKIPMYLCWYVPNRKSIPVGEQGKKIFLFKNYYTTLFKSATDVASHLISHIDSLSQATRRFHDILFSSTYPSYVIDAVSSQAASLVTNLVVHNANGNFYGYEGLSDQSGCCPGTCTHVWNYEQTLAFLFPSLERRMREIAFLYDTWDNGFQSFRTLFPPHGELWQFHPAADGQMGNIMRVYREWKLSGDNEWLKKMWPKTKLALEFAWKGTGSVPAEKKWMTDNQPQPWDADKDGVMEGLQHNTYDIEFYGPNPMITSLYLGALKACAEMATAMGEQETAKEYLTLYESGKRYCDEKLWNGRYYFQKVKIAPGLPVPDKLLSPKECMKNCTCKGKENIKETCCLSHGDSLPKYQYGEGCLADQLLGQYLAFVTGLGYLLDAGHVNKALQSIFDNNFMTSFKNFNNVQRVYALNDEAGLLLCTWPEGKKRPLLPFPYSDEVWTGIEYQVAASLIYAGMVNEGLAIVKAVRDRYNGKNRNPWDEIECGHHYARAMARWAVLLALSGYSYDGVAHHLQFNPAINKTNFSTFWSTASAWGQYKQNEKEISLVVDHGKLILSSIGVPGKVSHCFLHQKEIGIALKEGRIVFDKKIEINKGEVLLLQR